MTTVYLVEQSEPYEYSTIVATCVSREVAEATMAVWREFEPHPDYKIWEEELVSIVPTITRWFSAAGAYAQGEVLFPEVHEFRTTEHKSFNPEDQPPTSSSASVGKGRKPNPDHIKGTPFGWDPKTPNGRWLEYPIASAHAHAPTAEEAQRLAHAALQAKVQELGW